MRGKVSRMTEGGEEAEARGGEILGEQRGEEERKAGSSMEIVFRLKPNLWWRDREASSNSSCKMLMLQICQIGRGVKILF